MLEWLKTRIGIRKTPTYMDDGMKQIVEQNAALSIVSAELTSRLIFRLVNLKKISPGEALMIFGDLSSQMRDLAIRNERTAGMEVIFHQVADRIDIHSDQLQKDTGATVKIVKKPKK